MAGLIITNFFKRLLHGECVNMFLIGEYLAKLQARTWCLVHFFVFYMQGMEEFLITSYCKFTDESSSENIPQTATK